MFWKLLSLEWKSFFRSATLGKELTIKIIIGFFALYGLFSLLLLGVGMHFLIKELLPNVEPIQLINQYVVIWFVMELAVRYMMQKIPIINIKPFLIQNIQRKTLVNFILTKSIFSYWNILTPILVIPFSVVTVLHTDWNIGQLTGWTISILSMVLIANFLNIYIEKKILNSKLLFALFFGTVAVLYGLEYFELFSTSKFVGGIFDSILIQPFWCIIPMVLVLILYKINQKNLVQNFYLDAYLKTESNSFDDTDLSWTNRFGAVAPFMQLDMKLIWRNKRPKTTIYISIFFALYGLLFYTQDMYDQTAMWVFAGLFMTGMFMMNFGQFIPAWDSSYYPMMMTQNIPMQLYLNSKASLINFSIVVMTALTLPYGFFDIKILVLNLACAVYNLGINVPVILYAGSFNKKRIDLDKTQFSNYQGTGVMQWLIFLPLTGIPSVIWAIANYVGNFYIASAILVILGIIGFFLKNQLMIWIIEAYKRRKHAAINGFKQQNA
jgi:hypothetical protein